MELHSGVADDCPHNHTYAEPLNNNKSQSGESIKSVLADSTAQTSPLPPTIHQAFTTLAPHSTALTLRQRQTEMDILRRCKKALKSLLCNLFCKVEGDPWTHCGKICIDVEKEEKIKGEKVVRTVEVQRSGIILFDTQCSFDIISSGFLERQFNVTMEGSSGVFLGSSVTGKETYESIGVVNIRWWVPDRSCFEEATCHVMKSKEFDVIIGKKTIKKLNSSPWKRGILGAFMHQQPLYDSRSVRDQDKQAAERRREARKDKDRREAAKKSHQQRDKNKVSHHDLRSMSRQ